MKCICLCWFSEVSPVPRPLCVLVLHLLSALPANTTPHPHPTGLQAEPGTRNWFPPSPLSCCHQILGGRLCYSWMLSFRAQNEHMARCLLAQAGGWGGEEPWPCYWCWPSGPAQRGEWAVSTQPPSLGSLSKQAGLCLSRCDPHHTSVPLPLASQDLPLQGPHSSPLLLPGAPRS